MGAPGRAGARWTWTWYPDETCAVTAEIGGAAPATGDDDPLAWTIGLIPVENDCDLEPDEWGDEPAETLDDWAWAATLDLVDEGSDLEAWLADRYDADWDR